MKKRNPWSWIPTLYFAEGVPNVLVTVLAVIVYMQLGMTDTEQDQALVGDNDAAAYRSLAGWRGFHAECILLVSGHDVLLFPDGFLKCHP